MKKVFTLTLAVIAYSLIVISCSSDKVIDTPSGDDKAVEGAYILNNGQWGKNNSNLAHFSVQKEALTPQIFYTKNKKKIGDLGQAMICQDETIYLLVSGSSVLYRMDKYGKVIHSVLFNEQYSTPRDLVYHNEKLYVTFWDGSLVRYNAETLNEEAKLTIGKNPEKVVQLNDKLYVSDTGFAKENKVYEIDIRSFKVSRTIEVEYNPNDLWVVNDDVWVCSWGENNDKCSLQRVAVADKSYAVEKIADAKFIVQKDDLLYLVYTMTDFNLQKTENRFATYNLSTKTLSPESFIFQMPLSLPNEPITLFDYDAKHDNFYIGTSPDYTSNGVIYRFHGSGTFLSKFSSEGVLPIDILFF